MSNESNPPDLSGKTALVTGASRGIGRAIAISLAKRGAHILAIARTAGALEELDDEIRSFGGTASLIPMDLTDGNNIEELAAALADRFPKVDLLVLNAAILGELAPLPDIDPKVWQGTLDLNITANWRLLRAFDSFLKAADTPHVICLTSRVGGEMARAYWGAYAVSKAAFEMLASTYAEENKSRVSVTILDPGAMRTGMRAQAMPGEDPATLPSPDEIEPMIYRILENQPGSAHREAFRDFKAQA